MIKKIFNINCGQTASENANFCLREGDSTATINLTASAIGISSVVFVGALDTSDGTMSNFEVTGAKQITINAVKNSDGSIVTASKQLTAVDWRQPV